MEWSELAVQTLTSQGLSLFRAFLSFLRVEEVKIFIFDIARIIFEPMRQERGFK